MNVAEMQAERLAAKLPEIHGGDVVFAWVDACARLRVTKFRRDMAHVVEIWKSTAKLLEAEVEKKLGHKVDDLDAFAATLEPVGRAGGYELKGPRVALLVTGGKLHVFVQRWAARSSVWLRLSRKYDHPDEFWVTAYKSKREALAGDYG